MHDAEQDFSFRCLFFPLTNLKAIYWIIFIGFIVYFNSLFSAFVWDDIPQIQKNELVHTIANIPLFFTGSTFASVTNGHFAGLYYRPLMISVFSVIYTIFGAQPFFFHLFQLFLHILNACLSFILLKKFIKEKTAFFLSLIFLVHPINVESVSYIATLGEPLFFFFGILAVLSYQKLHLSWRNSIVISFLILLSILSKEAGIVFTGLILSSFFLFKKKNRLSFVITILIVTLPVIIYLFLRFELAKVSIIRVPGIPMMTDTLTQRMFTMPAIFFYYLKTFIFPKDLFIYQQWNITGPGSAFYFPLFLDFVIFGFFCIAGVWFWKTNKKSIIPFLFFVIWFLLGIGILLQILPLDSTVADHMFYFPIVGLLGIIGLVWQNIKKQNQNFRKAGVIISITIICLFSLRTFVRNTNWYDAITLYSHDLQYNHNIYLENLLGSALYDAGRYNEAAALSEKLIAQSPKEYELYANLGVVYQTQGKNAQAESIYRKGLILDENGAIYYNLAILLLQEGNIIQAKNIANQGTKKFPQNGTLWIADALADYGIGNRKIALEEARKAKAILPNPAMQRLYDDLVNNVPIQQIINGY